MNIFSTMILHIFFSYSHDIDESNIMCCVLILKESDIKVLENTSNSP